jgi:hypothetical protein
LIVDDMFKLKAMAPEVEPTLPAPEEDTPIDETDDFEDAIQYICV